MSTHAPRRRWRRSESRAPLRLTTVNTKVPTTKKAVNTRRAVWYELVRSAPEVTPQQSTSRTCIWEMWGVRWGHVTLQQPTSAPPPTAEPPRAEAQIGRCGSRPSSSAAALRSGCATACERLRRPLSSSEPSERDEGAGAVETLRAGSAPNDFIESVTTEAIDDRRLRDASASFAFVGGAVRTTTCGGGRGGRCTAAGRIARQRRARG